MDSTTKTVRDMYSRFPYPSPVSGRRKYSELANLLRLFCHETGTSLAGKRVLDAGTGSGHRLLEAAALYPDTEFLGVDMSETALGIARESCEAAGLGNVTFEVADLMDGVGGRSSFDVALAMGVLHHTADPGRVLRNLVATLNESGLLFAYVYGKWGTQERMRRKGILSVLLGGETDFEQGVELARGLDFLPHEYGWNIDEEDPQTVDALIVDSYLNVNDVLFDLEDLTDLMRSSGLHGFAPYGLTAGKAGMLFDVFPEDSRRSLTATTNFHDIFAHAGARAAFTALDLKDRYRLADLVYQPNGYTLLGFKRGALDRLGDDSRILRNACMLDEGSAEGEHGA